MRMRRKSNLDERIQMHPKYLLLHEIGYYEKGSEDRHGKFDLVQVFGNTNPVWLEIGCGKGGFAIELAKRNPDVNVLALEVVSNVIIEGVERVEEEKIENLRFINCPAEHLPAYFDDDSFERIFLNFSCPYPKNTYANRRLTATRFLQIYKKMLKKGCWIEQKTDNQKLFEFSIEHYSENGYLIKNITLDLHNSKYVEGNIITEYESKFIAQGLPIYRLEAHLTDK